MTNAAYRMFDRDCDADAFYAVACDPRRSVIVEACAGAGKTWMLVSRIVRALLDGAQPEQILAITFTRKAAGEMRERLHDWLREWSQCSDEVRIAALAARGVGAADARSLSPALAGLHARLLRAGQTLQVSTFHAWFARLLQLAPTELLQAQGLHAGMQLVEEIDEWKPALMQRFHRAVQASPVLLADYEALVERHRRSKLADWLVAVLDKRLEVEHADAGSDLETAVPGADECWLACAGLDHPLQRLRQDEELRATLRAAARSLGQRGTDRARRAAERLVSALDEIDPQRAWSAVQAALFRTDGMPFAHLEGADELRAVDACRALGEQVEQQEGAVDHRRMTKLARELLWQWRAFKRERALVDMPDLERCAFAVLSDSSAAGWVQQRLDARTRHVLIDEFQDTSPLQWQALQAWLSSYAGAGGGASGQAPPSLFVVGDPKQSIYRFRGAAPEVFALARSLVVDGLGGTALSCNHTRRCAPAVLAALNAVFGEATVRGDFEGFVAHSTAADPGVPGQVARLCEAASEAPAAAAPPAHDSDRWRDSLTVPRNEEVEPRAVDEARRAARAIASLVRDEGVAPGDLMVLARRRAPLLRLADALREHHLPCLAAEAVTLGELTEVQDLVSVLDALASPGHDPSLARALKSPLFGVADDDLLALSLRARDASGSTRWWSALQDWADAPARLAGARDQLARWASLARRLPPHDLLDRIVDEGDLMVKLAQAVPPDRLALATMAVTALLQQALAVDGGRFLSVYRFVRWLRQRVCKVAAPARPEAIRLLTIHGAKGLEARVVLVLDCDAQPARDAVPAVLVDWPVERSRPRGVAFAVNARHPAPSLRALQQREAAAAAREELNALYVAMTRASERLLFSRTVPQRAVGLPSWWSRIEPCVEIAPAAHAGGRGESAAPAPSVIELQRIASSPAVPVTVTADDDLPRRLGRAVHRMMQWSAALPDADLDDEHRLTHWAREAASAEALAPEQAIRIMAIARSLRRSAELRRFFDPGQIAWAGDEVELSLDGTLLRIDRLVLVERGDCPGWWVLDYKLAADAAADLLVHEQLTRYCAAVARVANGRPVHAAVVSADGRVHQLI